MTLFKYLKETLINTMKNVYLIGLILFLGTSAFSQSITNGDMESWPAGCPYNTAPDSWVNFTVGSSSLGPDQAGSCYGSTPAYEGDSYMNLVYTGSAEEGAEYTLSGLTIGVEYTITFHARNSDGIYASSGSGSIDVFHQGSVIYTTPELISPGSWAEYTANFTAATSTDNIAFRIVPGTGSSGSLGIDAVSISGGSSADVEDVLNVEFNGVETAEIYIYDLQGIKIKEVHGLNSQSSNAVDISEIPSGIYLVRLVSNLEITEKKILIE